MKKSIKILSLILCLTSFLMGCQYKGNLEDSVETEVKINTGVKNIEELNMKKNNITAKYPRLVNLENQKIEDKWNKIIEDRIDDDLELLSENDIYNLTYEVVHDSSKEISIKLKGDCSYAGAEQSYNFMYTYNISFETGESIRLCDLRDVNQLASQIYNNQGFHMESNLREEFMKYIYSAFDNEELLAEMLSNFDYYENTQLPYGYSFYEDNKLHLCVEVPHELGDYVILELENNK